jgi:hypothetical protein
MDPNLRRRAAVLLLVALATVAGPAPGRAVAPEAGPRTEGIRNVIRYVGCAFGIWAAPTPQAVQSMIISCASLLKFNQFE